MLRTVYNTQLGLGSLSYNTTTTFLGMPLSPTLNNDHCWEIISVKVQGILQNIGCAPLQAFNLLTGSSGQDWLDLEDYPRATIIRILNPGGLLY